MRDRESRISVRVNGVGAVVFFQDAFVIVAILCCQSSIIRVDQAAGGAPEAAFAAIDSSQS